LKALEDLDIKVEEKTKDGISGTIKAKRANDDPVQIKVKRESSESTIVRIRVGMFGDKGASTTIMEAMDKYLDVE